MHSSVLSGVSHLFITDPEVLAASASAHGHDTSEEGTAASK